MTPIQKAELYAIAGRAAVWGGAFGRVLARDLENKMPNSKQINLKIS